MAHDHNPTTTAGPGGNDNHDMMDMGCPMEMNFHMGNNVCILWESWRPQDNGSFVGSAIGIFVIAFIYEALKYYREKLFYDNSKSQLNELANKNCNQENLIVTPNIPFSKRLFNKMHIIQTIMHLIQITLSYVLMLIVMTYNVWLFLAVILGATLGYFFFGWIRNNPADLTEHCG